MHEPRLGPRSYAAAALICVLAAFAIARYGTHGELLRDGAIYVYSGQEMLRGVPPYVSVFDHKGPLASFLCAAGSAIAERTGRDELACIRAIFFATTCLSIAALYLLAESLFRSRWLGAFAALTFLGAYGFGAAGLGGPDPKTPVVLFQVLALLALSRQRWFVAGAAGAIASLGWQPTGIYSIAAVVLAWFQAERRGRAAALALLGTLAPWIACGAYFAARSALYEFVDGVLIFNLKYLDTPTTPWTHATFILTAIVANFRAAGFAIVFGLFAYPLLYAWRARESGSLGSALVRDRFSGVLLTFPAPVLWSLLDFQGYPDFFVFLPYAALGFGWLAEQALSSLGAAAALRPAAAHALRAALAAVLVLGATCGYWAGRPRHDLDEQRAEVRRIVAEHGDATIVSVGALEALVLAGRENPTRYGFIMRGIHRHIDAHVRGGFAGWLAELEAERPEVVLASRDIEQVLPSEFAAAWKAWIARYELDPAGRVWAVYVRRRET